LPPWSTLFPYTTLFRSRLVGGFAVDKGDVDFELPALSPVVPCGQVEGEGVGVDLVDAEVAEEDRIQGQEAIEEELLGIVVAVGKAGLDAETATAEKATGLLVKGFDAGGRFGILPQGLPIACPAAAGCRRAGRSGTGHLGAAGWLSGRLRGTGSPLQLTQPLLENHQRILLRLISLAHDLNLPAHLPFSPGNRGNTGCHAPAPAPPCPP